MIIDHRDDDHLMINIMAMTGRNQRGEEGLQPGRLQEHEGHVSLPFLLICLAWSLNDEVFDYGMFWRIVTESFWEKFSHDLPRSKLFNTRFCLQVRPEQAHLQSGQNKAPLGEKMLFVNVFVIHVPINV